MCLCCSPALQNDSTEANFELADCQFEGEQQLPNCPVMELVIHLASQASPELCWHGVIRVLCLKVTWIHPFCIAGQFQFAFSSPASFLIGVRNPPGQILSLLLQHPVTINRPRKLGLDSSHFWKQQPEPLILDSKIKTKRRVWLQ